MNSKFLRAIVLILQILCFAACIGACVYGLVVQQETEGTFHYTTTVIRVASLVLLTVAYYKSSVTSNNPGNLFTIVYMLLASIAELQILSYFSAFTGWSIIPPRASVRIQLFSYFMMYMSIIGFAIYFQNNEHTSITRFMLLSLAGSLFLSVFIPATQDIFGVWTMRAPRILITVLLAIALISNIILMSGAPDVGTTFRQIATLLLIVGSFLFGVLGSNTYIIVGTALYSVGALVLMVMSLRNSILL